MVDLFPRCPDPRRQPHRWQAGGSLYRHATSDGCNHLAGPSHHQPPLFRTRPLRSGFSRTIWRCRCSPSRRDRSSRRQRQWHLLLQHLRLKRRPAPVSSPLCRRRVWRKRPRRQRARHRRRYLQQRRRPAVLFSPLCQRGGGGQAPASADGTATLTAAPATGGTVPFAASVGGAPAPSAVAAASAEISAVEPATSGTVPSAVPIRGAVGARESSTGPVSSDAAAEAAPSTGDITAPVASAARAARKIASAAGSAGEICGERGGAPTPLIPVPCFRWRPATPATSKKNTTAPAAAGAAATTTPATTTPGGMQLVFEHCCDPLIRGNDAGGVRGEERRFSAWISLFTAGKHGGGCSMAGDGLRAEGEFLVLFGLCRERLENRVLETALVSCYSAHENHEGKENIMS